MEHIGDITQPPKKNQRRRACQWIYAQILMQYVCSAMIRNTFDEQVRMYDVVYAAMYVMLQLHGAQTIFETSTLPQRLSKQRIADKNNKISWKCEMKKVSCVYITF